MEKTRNWGRLSVLMTPQPWSVSHLQPSRTVSLSPLDLPSRPCPSAAALVLATREPFTDLGLPSDLAFVPPGTCFKFPLSGEAFSYYMKVSCRLTNSTWTHQPKKEAQFKRW